MSCPFCDRDDDLHHRTFYDAHQWYAFLGAPPYTHGHTLLARTGSGASCPEQLSLVNLQGLDLALAEVTGALSRQYSPKDILLASLRGRQSHLHFHLIPLWEQDESAWRAATKYNKGHLFQYLGLLEITGTAHALEERADNHWDEKEYRQAVAVRLQPEVEALRTITGLRRA